MCLKRHAAFAAVLEYVLTAKAMAALSAPSKTVFRAYTAVVANAQPAVAPEKADG